MKQMIHLYTVFLVVFTVDLGRIRWIECHEQDIKPFLYFFIWIYYYYVKQVVLDVSYPSRDRLVGMVTSFLNEAT